MLSFPYGTTGRSLGVRVVEMSWHVFLRFLLAEMEFLLVESIPSHSRVLSFGIIHYKSSITLNFNMQVPCAFFFACGRQQMKNKQK